MSSKLPTHLTAKTVLVLNKNWQAINTNSPVAVFGQMMDDDAVGLDIRGKDYMVPVTWEQWLRLPITEDDDTIGTPRGLVKIPKVVILSSYSRVPMRRPKLTKRAIRDRDKGKCQYTGVVLDPRDMTVDHILPRCKGGKTSWKNLVLSHRRVNSSKGGRTPEEAGLKLLKDPREPMHVPSTALLRNIHNIPEWSIFGVPGVADDDAELKR